MSSFIKRSVSLDQDSIGAYIKKIREKRNISIEDVSKSINVNIKYLEAIESASYKDLPKGIYSKIFFKKYIEFLGIKHKNVVNDFIKEQNRNQNFEKNIFFNKVVNWRHLLSTPKIARNILVFLVILVCFVYLFVYFKNIFSAPFLNIVHPPENKVSNEFNIEVEAYSEPGSEVRINGQLVLTDENGYFKSSVYLKSGLNVINVSSKKKYSKETIVIRQILVE